MSLSLSVYQYSGGQEEPAAAEQQQRKDAKEGRGDLGE